MANEITGDSGKVNIVAADLDITGWNLDITAEVHDISNTGGAGWAEFIGGMKGATGSFTANLDSLAHPTTTAPVITPGTAATIKLFTDGTKFFQGSCIITGLPHVSQVKGLITYTCNFTITGALTFPVD